MLDTALTNAIRDSPITRHAPRTEEKAAVAEAVAKVAVEAKAEGAVVVIGTPAEETAVEKAVTKIVAGTNLAEKDLVEINVNLSRQTFILVVLVVVQKITRKLIALSTIKTRVHTRDRSRERPLSGKDHEESSACYLAELVCPSRVKLTS